MAEAGEMTVVWVVIAGCVFSHVLKSLCLLDFVHCIYIAPLQSDGTAVMNSEAAIWISVG